MKVLRQAFVLVLVLTVLTGVLYPLAVTGIATVIAHDAATGSIIVNADGKPVGSRLIGQPFAKPGYFWSRPSATSSVSGVAATEPPMPYNASASSGSNLGPTNPDFLKAVADRVTALREAGGDPAAPVPVDLVTASGSGLDPDISPAAAYYQVARVARARGPSWSEADVTALVAEHTTGRFLGVFGEPRVNVLELNLALDAKPR